MGVEPVLVGGGAVDEASLLSPGAEPTARDERAKDVLRGSARRGSPLRRKQQGLGALQRPAHEVARHKSFAHPDAATPLLPDTTCDGSEGLAGHGRSWRSRKSGCGIADRPSPAASRSRGPDESPGGWSPHLHEHGPSGEGGRSRGETQHSGAQNMGWNGRHDSLDPAGPRSSATADARQSTGARIAPARSASIQKLDGFIADHLRRPGRQRGEPRGSFEGSGGAQQGRRPAAASDVSRGDGEGPSKSGRYQGKRDNRLDRLATLHAVEDDAPRTLDTPEDRAYLEDLVPFIPNFFQQRIAAAVEACRGPTPAADLPLRPSLHASVAGLLVADVTGFTELTERLTVSGGSGGESLVNALNDYFRKAMSVLYKYGGEVIKFAGDAMICVFLPEDFPRPGANPETPGEAEAALARCAVRAAYCAEELARRLGTVAMLPAGKVAVRKQHPLPIVWPLSAGDNASPDNEDGSSAVETGNEASEAFEALKGARTAAFDPRVVGKLRQEMTVLQGAKSIDAADVRAAMNRRNSGSVGSGSVKPSGRSLQQDMGGKNSRLNHNSRGIGGKHKGPFESSSVAAFNHQAVFQSGASASMDRTALHGSAMARRSVEMSAATVASMLAPPANALYSSDSIRDRPDSRHMAILDERKPREGRLRGREFLSTRQDPMPSSTRETTAGASDSGFRDVVQLQLKVLVACGRISLVHVQAQGESIAGIERWEAFVGDGPGSTDEPDSLGTRRPFRQILELDESALAGAAIASDEVMHRIRGLIHSDRLGLGHLLTDLAVPFGTVRHTFKQFLRSTSNVQAQVGLSSSTVDLRDPTSGTSTQVAPAPSQSVVSQSVVSSDAARDLSTATHGSASSGQSGEPVKSQAPPPTSIVDRMPLSALDERKAARLWQVVNGHVPQFLHERVKIGQGEFLNEVRMCSTMFIGLPGLERAVQDRASSPERALSVAIAHFSAIFAVINKLDGHMLQFRCCEKGYVAICAFGLPGRSHSDDTHRAVRAAIGIRDALASKGFGCFMGIATGKLLCATIGARGLHTEYTVFGNAINLSARLMVQARRGLGRLVCDDVTQLGARVGAAFETLSPVKVKGRTHPIHVYEIRDVYQSQAMVSGGLMGRDRELATLNRLLHRYMSTGVGHTVVLEAHSGMGKSAFMAYLRGQTAAETEMIVLDAKQGQRNSMVPFSPWAIVIQQIFSHHAVLNREDAGLRFMKALVASVPGYNDAVSSLAHALKLPRRLLMAPGHARQGSVVKSRVEGSCSGHDPGHAGTAPGDATGSGGVRRLPTSGVSGKALASSRARAASTAERDRMASREREAGSLPGGQDGGPVRTLSSCASSRPEGIPRPSQEGRSSFDEDSIADILVKVIRCAAGTLGKPVILLDDVQTFDRPSWMLLRNVTLGVEGVFVVLSVDPGHQAPAYARSIFSNIVASPRTERLVLDALSADQVLQLIHSLCGPDSIPAQSHHLIFERTQGHPLLTEQLLGYLSQMDPPDQLRAVHDLKSVVDDELPLTSLITNRIDALKATEQLTLKVASILGEAFTCHLLQAVHPIRQSMRALCRDLDVLVSNRFLEWADPGARERLHFAAGVVRDVAYSLVPATQRAKIHMAVGQQLLAAHRAVDKGHTQAQALTSAPVPPATLAEHFSRSLGYVDHSLSSRVRLAVELWEEAAQQALEHGADPEALALLEKAEETAYTILPSMDEDFHDQWDAQPSESGAEEEKEGGKRKSRETEKSRHGAKVVPARDVFDVDPRREALWSRIAARAYLGMGHVEAAVEALVMGLSALGAVIQAPRRSSFVRFLHGCLFPGRKWDALRVVVTPHRPLSQATPAIRDLEDVVEAAEIMLDVARRVMGPSRAMGATEAMLLARLVDAKLGTATSDVKDSDPAAAAVASRAAAVAAEGERLRSKLGAAEPVIVACSGNKVVALS